MIIIIVITELRQILETNQQKLDHTYKKNMNKKNLQNSFKNLAECQIFEILYEHL